MGEIKLKPCPFCGCNDRRVAVRRMGKKGYRIVCTRCGSMGPQINTIDNDKMGAQKMASEVWNRHRREKREWMSCKSCKYKVPGEIPGEGDMVCNNGISARFEETVAPDDCCGEYKQDWRAGFMRRFTRIN